jgi:hypothetical protein
MDFGEWRGIIWFVILPVMFFVIHRTQQKRQSLLQNQASKRGGSVSRRYFFEPYKLNFQDEGCDFEAWFHSGNKNSPSRTVIQSKLANVSDFGFAIKPENLGLGILKIFGYQDYQIGNEKFDSKFIISTDNEIRLRNFLSFEVQQELLNTKTGRPSVSFENSVLEVLVPTIADSDEELDELINLTQALTTRLKDRY